MWKAFYSFCIILTFLIVISILASCAPHSQPTYQTQSKKHSRVEHKKTFNRSIISQQFIKELNKLRAQGRVCGDQYFPATKPLVVNEQLTQAAYHHSLDMYQKKFIDHISSNGDTLVERLQKVNYAWRAIAENVAHNQRSAEQVLEDWLSSPGHCSNMMSSEYLHTGVAQVHWYWTQVYATPK